MDNWKITLRRLLYELVVVFVGVYLAFLFNELQQQQLETRKKVQIIKGLKQEIELFIAGAEYHLTESEALISTFEAARAEGDMPIPFRYVYTGADRPPNSFWQATLASGAIDLLDIELLTRIALYYNQMESALRKYNALYVFGQEKILPYEHEAPESAFYTEGRQLKPMYVEYIGDFKTYQRMGTSLQNQAQELAITLDQLVE